MSIGEKFALMVFALWLIGAFFGTRMFLSWLDIRPRSLEIQAWFVAELAMMRGQDKGVITGSTVISHKEIAAGIVSAIEDHGMRLAFNEEMRAFVRESRQDGPDTKTVGEFVRLLESQEAYFKKINTEKEG